MPGELPHAAQAATIGRFTSPLRIGTEVRQSPLGNNPHSEVDDVLAVRFKQVLDPAAIDRFAFFNQLDLVVGAIE